MNNEMLLEIAKQHEEPIYAYDLDTVSSKLNTLLEVITWRPLRIYYAMKANHNPDILKLMLNKGAFLDTVSLGEIELATRLGFPSERMLNTSNNIIDGEMNNIHSRGVLMNIDSLSRLEKFGTAHPNSDVYLRFNPEVVAGEFPETQTGGPLTKFGILLKDVELVKEIVKRYNLRVVGLHKHTGSGIKESSKFLQAMRNLLSIATRDNFPHLKSMANYNVNEKNNDSDDENDKFVLYSDVEDV